MAIHNISKIFALILMLSFIVVPSTANALSIGTAPGVLDMGDVPRGAQKLVEFYAMTNSDEDLLVNLNYIAVHSSIYDGEKTTYKFVPSEASEEDISSWLTIPQNSIVLSPSKTQTITFADGTSIRYNKKITLVLNVPKDAEPGYHAGAINLQPRIDSDGSGAGVSSIGVTRFVFVFRVPGNAVREGNIIDVEAEREAENKVRIDILFKNTGTTTVSASLDNIVLYDNYGLVAENIAHGQVKKVEPGKTAILSGYWTGGAIASGEYDVDTKVSYITGSAIKELPVTVPAVITIPDSVPTPQHEFPWWLVVIVMMLIGLYVYWRMD